MQTEKEIKEIVRQKYAHIAEQSRTQNASSCCGSGCGCGPSDVTVMADDYSKLDGYVAEADLGLGCGIPTEIAAMKPGDTVLDLGSGAGNDVFVARHIVGEKGRVIGVDMTEIMIERANENNRKLGYNNVEFRLGDIESLPVSDRSVDVVISNCVLNLVPNKAKAFSEIYRVLKSAGHFSISDIVTTKELPPALRSAAGLYAGCVGGALVKEAYLDLFKSAGFRNVEVRKERKIELPDDILASVLPDPDLRAVKELGTAIVSVTISGEK